MSDLKMTGIEFDRNCPCEHCTNPSGTIRIEHGKGLDIKLHGLDHDPERAEEVLRSYVNLLNVMAHHVAEVEGQDS